MVLRMGETRPRDFSPQELGFTPQRAVPWLNPRLLAGTGVRTVFSDLFGAYLDKREMQAVLGENRHDYSAADELWIDYTADVGDGFDATYSIASLIARPTLEVPGPDGSPHVLPRGDLLVLGGDQVYPTASGKAYGDRWKGPYRAALPEKTKDTPDLYALPGNHDWYDGLTAFLRLFAQGDCIGGWQTRQQRSYFALALPHRWWLFAIDTQLDVYIDKPQLRYFTAAAKDLRPDDKVIVCTPRPTWVISPVPGRVRQPRLLRSHDRGADRGPSADHALRGRAPLRAVHRKRTRWPWPGAGHVWRWRCISRGDGAPAHADRGSPTSDVDSQGQHSPALRPGGDVPHAGRLTRARLAHLLATAHENPGLLVLLGLMQTLLMFALRTAHGRWLNAPIAVAVGAVVAGTLLFATITALDRTRPRHWIAALLHAIPHVALGVVGTAAWTALPVSQLSNPWSIILAFAIYFPVIAVLDAFIVGAYLIVGSRFQVNVNELYAGLGIEDFKEFPAFAHCARRLIDHLSDSGRRRGDPVAGRSRRARRGALDRPHPAAVGSARGATHPGVMAADDECLGGPRRMRRADQGPHASS